MNCNYEHEIITDAIEFLNIDRNEIEKKISEMENTLHKIWNNRNPQTYIDILNFYQTEELAFYNVIQFNTWSNAQKPSISFKKFPIKTALDFGCGGGTTALYLAEQGYEVDICDVNSKLVEFTKFRLNKNGYQCNIIPLDKFKPLTKNYDFITTIDVLEHVLNPLELIIHFRKHSKYWYSTALKPSQISQHLCLWDNEKIIDIIKSIGWNPIWLAGDEGRGFFE